MAKQCIRFYSESQKKKKPLLISVKRDSSVTTELQVLSKAHPNSETISQTRYLLL